MDKKACTFFLAIDENGNFVVEKDREDVLGNLADDQGELADIYEITLMVRPAKSKAVKIDIPEDNKETVELAAEEA